MDNTIKPILIYCYDAYCGWCYGFSPIIKKIAEAYQSQFDFEVLSGGMMIDENKAPIEKIAPFIESAYTKVEELTGIKFGQDFLWHIHHPEKSDWILNSEKPAIALCVFKDYYPLKQIEIASELQYALNFEGRDLDDDESYRHLVDKYNIPATDFYIKLKSEIFKDKARYEFSLCKQLGATSFPQVLLQLNESKFYLLANGFTNYDALKTNIESVLAEINSSLN